MVFHLHSEVGIYWLLSEYSVVNTSSFSSSLNCPYSLVGSWGEPAHHLMYCTTAVDQLSCTVGVLQNCRDSEAGADRLQVPYVPEGALLHWGGLPYNPRPPSPYLQHWATSLWCNHVYYCGALFQFSEVHRLLFNFFHRPTPLPSPYCSLAIPVVQHIS